MHPIFEEELKELDDFIIGAERRHLESKYTRAPELRFLERLRNFLGAANYDKERYEPASDEAHQVWFRIMDKPHWALPQIQYLIDERDEARENLKKAQELLEEYKSLHERSFK